MNYNRHIILMMLSSFVFMISCTSEKTRSNTKAQSQNETNMDQYVKDVHSFARPNEARTTHLQLNLQVDFENRVLDGYADHTVHRNGSANQFVVDTRNLDIVNVTDPESKKDLKFTLGEEDSFLGSALSIELLPKTEIVRIQYRTRPDAAAIDWLDPIQTADKKSPFMFTQGQAILTRTWIPLQDSPGIRFSYDADIRVPKGMMAAMSAENPTEVNPSGEYTFKMVQPIPAYLIAIAVGDFVFKPIGPRTGVYAEHSLIDASVAEFEDMEEMLTAAEELYGKYLWDRYDLIVLPPSFPFGGMENPRLTFATPTIIAGDKSLISLVAHELAHSWSGNLVTNATWDDFWLNEGFTVYFERRIMEAISGKEYTDMLAMLGRQDLEASIEDLPERDTHLYLHLEGRDPDDGMTDIAYEKGALLLTTIEEEVGREKFDAFLKNYFESNKFESMSTAKFEEYINKNLLEPNGVKIDLDSWIHGPGIPEGASTVTSDRFSKVDDAVTAFTNGNVSASSLETSSWSTHEWLHFIRHLPKNLSNSNMKKLDQAFGFSNSGNSEILAAWFDVAIRNGYNKEISSNIENFLVRVGRRKFLTPLYRAFKESGQLDTAQVIYTKAKDNYHSVSRGTLEAMLNE